VVLRDPTKRAYSHYWHSRRLGFETAPSFEAALDLETDRLASGERSTRSRYSYVDRGHYIEQLLELEKAYGPDQLHVVLLEELIMDQRPCLEDCSPSSASRPNLRTPSHRNGRTATGSALVKSKAKKPVDYPPMAPRTRTRLVEHFRPDNDRLSAWLGRDLSEWDKP